MNRADPTMDQLEEVLQLLLAVVNEERKDDVAEIEKELDEVQAKTEEL